MKTDERFEQLLSLARDGDECAEADLFKEFGVTVKGGDANDAG